MALKYVRARTTAVRVGCRTGKHPKCDGSRIDLNMSRPHVVGFGLTALRQKKRLGPCFFYGAVLVGPFVSFPPLNTKLVGYHDTGRPRPRPSPTPPRPPRRHPSPPPPYQGLPPPASPPSTASSADPTVVRTTKTLFTDYFAEAHISPLTAVVPSPLCTT